MKLGGYTWEATLDTGLGVHQELADGTEQSVDHIRDHAAPLAVLELLPQTDTHRRVRLDVAPGQDWIKHWTRTMCVDERGNQVGAVACVDTLGIVTEGGERVYLHIYGDGTLKLTTNPEP